MRLILFTIAVSSAVIWAMPWLLHQEPFAPPAGRSPVLDDGGSTGWNSIAIDGGGGQFVARAAVNGVDVDFLIDSGASFVVLAPQDARRIGFRQGQLRFTGSAETANGRVRLAPVILRELRIGQLSRRGLPAVVNEAPMAISLLGMSFLRSLQGWEVRGERLLLEW